MNDVTLLVNPRAGAGRARAVGPRVERAFARLGVRAELVWTSGPSEATELVRAALRRGTPGVAVVGGDGTLSEAANGFFEAGRAIDARAWLAPISAGTGGDFRKTLGSANWGWYARSIEATVERIWRAPVRRIDVGHLRYVSHGGEPRERVFLNIASFGVGGLVDRLVNDAPKWTGGRAAFLLGTARALLRYRPQRVRVRLDDGEPREATITNVAVANGRFFGGGMKVAPEASLDDGRFDVVTMHAMDLGRALRTALRIYRGTHVGQPGVEMHRAEVVEAEPIDPTEAVLLDVDGEAPGRLPARFCMLPSALPIRT